MNLFSEMKTLNMGEKANILAENVVFIILNLIFFAMLLVFIYIQSSNTSLLEQRTAKQLALLIDAAKPDTEIKLDLKDILEKAGKNKISENDAIQINNDNNLVVVKLSEKSYYEYAFFNDVDVLYKIKDKNLEITIK